MIRLTLTLISLTLTCGAVAHAQADYPARPVQFVVPFSPGGATDIITRIMSDQFQVAFHRGFPVENRTGAGGNIGAAFVANAEPDGYSIFMGSPGPLVTNEFLYPDITFDPTKAFAPVVLVARLPNVLVVNPSLGVKTVQQLIDKVRANPGMNYASGGTGASGHLSMELFKAMTKTNFTHIPYKGTGQSLQDVLAGRVPVTFDNLTPILPYIKSGSLIALGVSTSAPVAVLPHIPPVAQTVPGFEASSWVAIVAPAKTPSNVIARLNEAANRILAKADVRQKLIGLSAEPAGGSPDDLRKLLAAERIKWKALIETAGIKVGKH